MLVFGLGAALISIFRRKAVGFVKSVLGAIGNYLPACKRLLPPGDPLPDDRSIQA